MVWIAIASLAFSIIVAVIGAAMFIQGLKGSIQNNSNMINNLREAHKTDIKYMSDKMETQNAFNAGVFKEIKDELSELHALMMQIIQNMPKRSGE